MSVVARANMRKRPSRMGYGAIRRVFPKCWINVYSVERCYGGQEEGRWWYDSYECVHSVRVAKTMVQRVAKRLAQKYASLAWGNISSVLGGVEVSVLVEDAKAKSETTERPYYC